MKELEGKTALVTGASRGIGAATAITLAQHGVAKVAIHYGGYREGAEQTLAKVREAGADGMLLSGDLATEEGINAFLAQVKQEVPAVDILINNAGSLVKRGKLDEMTAEAYDQIMNLNVKSVFFLTQAVTPHMVSQGSGVVINLSSIAARTGGGMGAMVYAAAKAAVSAMTKGMAKELAPKGIRVNAVSPGTVDNHFHQVFSTAQMLETMKASAPAGTLGTNEEVADTILFLCTNPSRYIHGQTIEINGGMFMV